MVRGASGRGWLQFCGGPPVLRPVMGWLCRLLMAFSSYSVVSPGLCCFWRRENGPFFEAGNLLTFCFADCFLNQTDDIA